MPMLSKTEVGMVIAIWGQAWVRDGHGMFRPVKLGDVVHKGEFVLTAQNAIVQIADQASDAPDDQAKVENISPDSVVDEKGNAYYQVRVRTVKVGFSEKLLIIPGMTAEVDVLTGRKTVLNYLLKPVLKVQSRALSER